MRSIQTNLFSLEHSLFSGQCFGWKRIDNWYYGKLARKPVKLKQERDILWFDGATEKEVKEYLALDEDLKSIYRHISKNDRILSKAIKEFNGLRILRQDPWETIVSFICSAFSNIPRIEKNLSEIRRKYGKKIRLDDQIIYLFPSPASLSKASVEDLRKMGLGYRDKYVERLSKTMTGFKISDFKKESYENVKKLLLKIDGIGEKVADCICLFSLDKHEAFPIDVWIANAMKEYYGEEIKSEFPGTKFSYKDVQAFARKKWDSDAGYAQQYIYVYSRKHLKKDRK